LINTYYLPIISSKAIVRLDGSQIEKREKRDFPEAKESFAGEFYTGEALKELCADFLIMPRRDAYHAAESFVNNTDTVRLIGLVYGMRSTGKTVILKQLAGRPEFLEQSAYLTLNYGEYNVDDIYIWVTNLQKTGIKYFYIDEITWADGFIDRAMAFADRFASSTSVKIILSGTDSLAFTFAKQSSLHGRYLEFGTTRMSYPEYFRLTGGNILDYVHSGGVFWKNKRPVQGECAEYLEASVVDNIYRSIRNSGRMTLAGEELRDLTKKELYAICYAICEGIANMSLRKRINELWDEPFELAVDKVTKLCSIRITEVEKSLIKSFAPAYHVESSKYDRAKVDAVLALMESIGFLWRTELRTNIEPKVRTALKFSQTGIEREFTRDMLAAVCQSGEFSIERTQAVMQSIEEYTDGSLLESACMITFAKRVEKLAHPGISLSYYRIYNGDHEIDVVLYDPRSGILYLYEVKRSQSVNSENAKHLSDNEFIEYLQNEYGAKSVTKAVLYRGVDNLNKHNGDIPFYKIEDYLMRIENGEIF